MQINRILFPTDFSHSGDGALATAESLARDNGATLFVLHVEELPAAYGGGEMYYGILEPSSDELKRMLLEVKPKDAAIPVEHHLVTGDPGSAIPQFAQEHNIDLIVISSHGRTGLMRLLMGSVAEAIVRRSPCAVLTVKATVPKKPG